ncbi:hypothetical protein [Tessaracoccus flavus]|uniref:Uncharacterized protein n=1 Tax=Tessaracoccus flavus TaxID=1610493 RepID=A0A1Q2CFC7_9ACTN|nr:hypothetical protein [Tessaracoccus flavus]AQP44797.1 hypothetical protein RPIT_08290 [Tessaracoccus flavus]SDZ19349.1 hypothetical protein SAMN05428934_11517 [Tessaracoccus flavus]
MALDFIITLALAIGILAIAAGLTARSRRARPAVAGLGLAMIPVGLYLTGLTTLIINGVRSIIDWLMRTPWTDAISWGIGLLVGGIVLLVIAGFLPREAKPRPVHPDARATAPAKQASTAPGQRPVAPPAKPGPAPATAKSKAAADPEDAEIEELLRKRGIM